MPIKKGQLTSEEQVRRKSERWETFSKLPVYVAVRSFLSRHSRWMGWILMFIVLAGLRAGLRDFDWSDWWNGQVGDRMPIKP